MKKLFLLVAASAFIFAGCSEEVPKAVSAFESPEFLALQDVYDNMRQADLNDVLARHTDRPKMTREEWEEYRNAKDAERQEKMDAYQRRTKEEIDKRVREKTPYSKEESAKLFDEIKKEILGEEDYQKFQKNKEKREKYKEPIRKFKELYPEVTPDEIFAQFYKSRK